MEPDAAAEVEPSKPMLVEDIEAQTSNVIELAGTVVALEKAGDHKKPDVPEAIE